MKNTKLKRNAISNIRSHKRRVPVRNLNRTVIHTSHSLTDLIEISEILTLESKGIKAAPPSSSFVKSMINKYELLDSESKDKMLHEVNRRIVELNSIRNRPSEKSMRAYKKLVKDD